MAIRQFEQRDFPAILEIYALSKLDELRFEFSCFQLLPLEQDARRLSQLLASEIYVFDSGKIEGYGALFRNEIRALFVNPHCRQRGVGSQLMQFMLASVTGSAELYIAKSNLPARRLYEKFGFDVVDEFETDYNGVPVVASKMRRL